MSDIQASTLSLGLTQTTCRLMISLTGVLLGRLVLQNHLARVVPLGDEAHELVTIENHERTDVQSRHFSESIKHRAQGPGRDGIDIESFGFQDLPDGLHFVFLRG